MAMCMDRATTCVLSAEFVMVVGPCESAGRGRIHGISRVSLYCD